mmetsp:Transcript_37460/g.50855  ORF Transcript_37460/g.50855 Transcript_37460/m.50855 type:complete len:81 (-) Transcript_37460:65-307(-)
MVPTVWGPMAQQASCPYCKHQGITVTYKGGLSVIGWIVFFILLVFFWPFCLCFIPFCIPSLHITHHKCVSCGQNLGMYQG